MTHTVDTARVEAFAQQVIGDQGKVFGGVLTYLGDKLGLYRAMADAGPLTPVELAERTGCDQRSLREWLAAQAAAGYVDYGPETGVYVLPDEHAAVLAIDDLPSSVIGGIQTAAAGWADADRIAEAFRSGAGLAWHERDPRMFSGTERFYTPGYRASLVDEWLPALDGVLEKLQQGGRVLDVGTGHAAPLLLMAAAFPASTFVGVDYHAASIETATLRAAQAGLADRVNFEVASSTGYESGGWDLITFFDVLHDLGDPVSAAAHARSALAPGGTVLFVEPRAGDHVEDNLNPLGELFYAASTMFCTQISLAQQGPDGAPGAALGAQAGFSELRSVLVQAGFTRIREAAQGPVNSVVEARA